jgi:hypothetical protein
MDNIKPHDTYWCTALQAIQFDKNMTYKDCTTQLSNKN